MKGGEGAAILEEAARHAAEQAAYQAGEEAAAGDVIERAEDLIEGLPGAPQDAFLEDLDYTIGRLRELVGWLAVEAGGTPDGDPMDGSVIEPEEAVMEALHTARAPRRRHQGDEGREGGGGAAGRAKGPHPSGQGRPREDSALRGAPLPADVPGPPRARGLAGPQGRQGGPARPRGRPNLENAKQLRRGFEQRSREDRP